MLFPISQVVDPRSNLPNTVPSAEVFSEHMQRLGIGRYDEIVCYDATHGMFMAARAAWMLTYFGATNVKVLNGGLLKWLKEERAIENGPDD